MVNYNKIILGGAVVIIIILLFKNVKMSDGSFNRNTRYGRTRSRSSFIPQGTHSRTWDEWDDYEKKYGNTRSYWGKTAAGGGWEGSPYSPTNNPSGTYKLGGPYRLGQDTTNRHRSIAADVNLVNSTTAELGDLYRSGIMY